MKNFMLIVIIAVASSCTAHRGLCGAYAKSHVLSQEDRELYQQTCHDTLGLRPRRVSTQVVAGTNYRYQCRDHQGHRYEVTIFQQLPCYGGQTEIIGINQLEP